VIGVNQVERTWTISIVGIIVALGGLGFIAIFFAIVGHFFTQNSKRKVEKSVNKSKVNAPESAPTATMKNNVPQVIPTNVNVGEEDEIVAVISAAIASFGGDTPRILSVKKVGENMPRNLWRFHDTQRIWRINHANGKGALRNG